MVTSRNTWRRITTSIWSSLANGTSTGSVNSGIFQKKVRRCSMIVCIISKDFCCSRICEQFVYFCQHRKKIIPVVYKDVEMPYWISMLVGIEEFIDGHGQKFEEILLKRVKQALNPDNIGARR